MNRFVVGDRVFLQQKYYPLHSYELFEIIEINKDSLVRIKGVETNLILIVYESDLIKVSD